MYSDLCFKEFGDRVKHWVTFSEPTAYTLAGYTVGTFLPIRCSTCKGNLGTESLWGKFQGNIISTFVNYVCLVIVEKKKK